ncbi:MAG: FtsH protease activity modulator HflK [Deltaproteobacteria bacterium]|nr:FtsH protease activity modulator HflK [Deltaproteobacteria bacterium]
MDRRVRTSLFSIGTDIFLTSVKGFLAAITGSVAILADAYHSFSDLIVSCTVLTGILLRRRQEQKAGSPDAESGGGEEKPMPGYWIESVVAYFVALVILYTAYEVVSRVVVPRVGQITNIWVAIVGITACVGIAYFISRFKLMVGRETDSPALTADGYHSRMDMFTSIAVLLSLMGQWIGIGLDRVVAVLIAVMIAITGLNLLISSFVSFFRKSHVDVRGIWETLSASLNWIVRFVSEHIFRRKISLPEIDFSRLRPSPRFLRRSCIVIVIVLLVIYLRSGITAVNANEMGVRLRFGAIIGKHLEPGLHFALPWPFEKILKMDAHRIYRVEVGFRTDPLLTPATSALLWEATHQVPGYKKINEESVTLTGDENLVDLSLVVQFRPRDLEVYFFGVRQVEEIMRGIAESYMREVMAGEESVKVMTDDRSRLIKTLKDKISGEVDRIGIGVEVMDVLIHDFHPPLDAVPSFRDVFSAREDQGKVINQAKSYRNMMLPKARAEREKQLAEARGYEVEKEMKAEGDAQKFLLTSKAYRESPEITAYRLYIETMEKKLARKKKFIADPNANLGGYRLWLFAPGAGQL